ncbi:hypothetical protein HYE67_007863 [Fusarium culmorum]|uniref:Uncharacterized protein n=1 Tax=Fusarium culmorum TaxID=5516 RepID=A0A2T4GEX7_FUSCU|nr:hypothetical protein FCULG_00012924 [Fusarium culmorum]QPC65632.1 hypothetical protein HYE67_007863 [Fusarium culmorum]
MQPHDGRTRLEQYFMSLALRAPEDLFVRLNRLMGALSIRLMDPKTGRPFEARIPRSCFPPDLDPEEEQKRMIAETQGRMCQAEVHARQVEQAQRQLEAHHFINKTHRKSSAICSEDGQLTLMAIGPMNQVFSDSCQCWSSDFQLFRAKEAYYVSSRLFPTD